MAYAALFSLTILLTPTQAVHMCTTLDGLKGVDQGIMLPRSQITNLTLRGIATCSTACLLRRICKSFNFNIETGECQLNSKTKDSMSTQLESHEDYVFSDISHWPERLAGVCANHKCPLNSYCDPVDSTSHVCRVTNCPGTPSVENGHLSTKPEASPLGTRLPLTCDPGYMAGGDVVCRDDGTWSSPMCASVSSCSMVKQYQPDSEDGEYWLRLTNFGNYTTKIYCHLLSSQSPQEFLSLLNINYGIYPLINDLNCRGVIGPLWGDCKGKGGEIWFRKIRVNIITMEAVKKDRTFANISSEEKLYYGSAWDCYTPHPKNKLRCGTKGRFNIDLRGTGWRVCEDQEWETYGWRPMIESIDRQMNGTVVNLRCGGHAGGCRPTGGLFLTPLPEDQVRHEKT